MSLFFPLDRRHLGFLIASLIFSFRQRFTVKFSMRKALQKRWLHIWRKICCCLSVYQLNKGKIEDLLSCYVGSHEMTFKTCQGLINRSPHHHHFLALTMTCTYVHRHAHKMLPRPWHSSQSEKPAFSQALKLCEMSAC